MRALRAFWMRLRSFVRREDDSDFDQEVASHLQLHIDDNLRAGMTPAQARRAALLKFGGVEAVRDAHRQRPDLPLGFCLSLESSLATATPLS
jgi:hypothetical protein